MSDQHQRCHILSVASILTIVFYLFPSRIILAKVPMCFATSEEISCHPFMDTLSIVLACNKSSHIQTYQSHACSRSPEKQVVSHDRWVHLYRYGPHCPRGASGVHCLCCTVGRGDSGNISYRVRRPTEWWTGGMAPGCWIFLPILQFLV